MNYEKIHIDEEKTYLIWGLSAVVSIAAATYILSDAFVTGSWGTAGYKQFTSLILFIVGIYGIIRISSPLYHFDLYIEDSMLCIKIQKGEQKPLEVQKISLDAIRELRIAPHTPRSSNEALFDFTTNYHLLYKDDRTGNFERLIYLEGETFTLKVKDIRKIIGFLVAHKSDISIPDDQTLFLQQG
ncbi:MAG TPA: hypothetical protein VE868_10385 [Balneolaceae bacterium]|nr:hypothetical protein [Balneolaceae bacterium]